MSREGFVTISKYRPFLVCHNKGHINVTSHYHNGCEIYFFISGDVEYFVENKKYSLKCGDIMITREDEIHSPVFNSQKDYERIFIQFDPALLDKYKTPSFNVLDIFYKRNAGVDNKLSLNESGVKKFWELLNKLIRADSMEGGTSEMLRDAYFYEILAFLHKSFYDQEDDDIHALPDKLVPVIEYIESHLDSDLSLDVLENKFYINRYYLCRIFKKNTNVSLHDFIVYKRINRAKLLLSEGYSVTEVAQMAGFNDYSNFIRVFGKIAGISPGKYKKQFRT